MKTTTILFYPSFLVMTFILTLIFIPRKDYKSYLIYGFLVGGLGDILVVGLFQNILHVVWFKNQGIFNVYEMNALSPPSWTVTVMIFLYFLPGRRTFLYPYIIAWAGCSVAFGLIVHNSGLFDFLPWFYPIPSYFTFLGWWTFCAWLFYKTSPLVNHDYLLVNIRNKNLKQMRFKLAPAPARKSEKKERKIRLRKPTKIR